MCACCVAYSAPFTTAVMKNDDDQDDNESGKWGLRKKSKIRKMAKKQH